MKKFIATKTQEVPVFQLIGDLPLNRYHTATGSAPLFLATEKVRAYFDASKWNSKAANESLAYQGNTPLLRLDDFKRYGRQQAQRGSDLFLFSAFIGLGLFLIRRGNQVAFQFRLGRSGIRVQHDSHTAVNP
jgi:hypothetical protein